jgi:hypothetical protein
MAAGTRPLSRHGDKTYEVRTDLLKKQELILYRRDFRYLVVFAAADGKVMHLHRLASSLDAGI